VIGSANSSQIKCFKESSKTDLKGKFNIKLSEPIVKNPVSIIGYNTQIVNYTTSTLNVELQPAALRFYNL